MSAVVAVVDDERSLLDKVGQALCRNGHHPVTFHDPREAWDQLRHSLPDLLILDIIMPGMDGLELFRRFRALSSSLPIIFLTSKDDEFDRVLGLEIGADDYLCKPFSLRELMARVGVLLRRARYAESGDAAASSAAPTKVLTRGPLELDLERYTTQWMTVPVALTVTEFRIMRALAQTPGVVKTRAQLLADAFPHDGYMSLRSVDTHIRRIRRKMEQADPQYASIEAVYGLGYRFRLPKG